MRNPPVVGLSNSFRLFRDQKMTLEQQVALGKRFGTGELHFHPNVPGPKGFPEVLPIKSNKDSNNVAGEAWHTDVSCDLRPPGLSILRIEETPPFGGDTLWASTTALYAKLSPTLRAYLDTLSAVHDSLQAGHGRHKASETLSETQQKYPRNVHPLIRTHPITGQRCLYVNSGFTTGIAGLGERESRGLLDVLFNHIASSPECHVRWRWSPNSVAIWDNRCTQHMVRSSYGAVDATLNSNNFSSGPLGLLPLLPLRLPRHDFRRTPFLRCDKRQSGRHGRRGVARGSCKAGR